MLFQEGEFHLKFALQKSLTRLNFYSSRRFSIFFWAPIIGQISSAPVCPATRGAFLHLDASKPSIGWQDTSA